MNNKGFMFVETIVTTAILLVALMAIYVSYSSFIIGEKRRLYYDDIAYIYKTMDLRNTMYDSTVYINYNGVNYYNVDALKKYIERIGRHYYIIKNGQSMFKPVSASGDAVVSENFKSLMDSYNVSVLIYIPKFSDITEEDIINLQRQSDSMYIRDYFKKLDVKCEKDISCKDKYNGIIVSVIRQHRNGDAIEDDYNNFAQCMQAGNKKTMECQDANYLTWVYA